MVSYIPKNFPAAGEGILILAARGETAEDYLEKKDFGDNMLRKEMR